MPRAADSEQSYHQWKRELGMLEVNQAKQFVTQYDLNNCKKCAKSVQGILKIILTRQTKGKIDSASPFYAECCGFESHRGYHLVFTTFFLPPNVYKGEMFAGIKNEPSINISEYQVISLLNDPFVCQFL